MCRGGGGGGAILKGNYLLSPYLISINPLQNGVKIILVISIHVMRTGHTVGFSPFCTRETLSYMHNSILKTMRMQDAQIPAQRNLRSGICTTTVSCLAILLYKQCRIIIKQHKEFYDQSARMRLCYLHLQRNDNFSHNMAH